MNMEQINIARELEKAHGQLQELYRGKSTNTVLINQLWNRINTLEAAQSQHPAVEGKRVIG